MNYQKSYYPKKPVKSFQDLEVYQKVLGIATVVTKRIMENLNNAGKENNVEIVKAIAAKLTDHLLALPVMLASAHSMRFSYQAEAIKKLEEAMLYCNLSAVYLEQYRDLGKHEIETEFFEEQIKSLLLTRGKIMRLQMSWKKFYNEKNAEGLRK